MSIRIKNFGQAFLRNIPLIGCFIAIFFSFRALSGTSAAIFFLSFFFLYMMSMIASSHGVSKLEEYERSYTLTTQNRLKFSLLASFPTYPMWLISSLFPIKTWYAWVVTGFPLIVVGTLPIFAICDEYWHRAPKLLLWACHLGTYILCFFIGQILLILLT